MSDEKQEKSIPSVQSWFSATQAAAPLAQAIMAEVMAGSIFTRDGQDTIEHRIQRLLTVYLVTGEVIPPSWEDIASSIIRDRTDEEIDKFIGILRDAMKNREAKHAEA